MSKKYDNPLISVIIPIYNVEKYLNRCIESVINQSYRNIEIILVDDGSPDSCGEICDFWAKKDERIVVIHKENGGLGKARNTGIKVATGQLVGFVDADDYISSDFYNELCEKLLKYNADVCISGLTDVYPDREIAQSFSVHGCYEGEDIKKYILAGLLGTDCYGQNGLGQSVCKGLYNRDLLLQNNIWFPSEREMISEDTVFNIYLYKTAKCVAVSQTRGYFYCHRTSSSLTTSYRLDRIEKYKLLRNHEIELIQDEILSEELIERINNTFLANIRVSLLQICGCDKSISTKLRIIKNCVTDKDLIQVIMSYPFYHLPIKQHIFCWALRTRMSILVYLLCKLHIRTKE